MTGDSASKMFNRKTTTAGSEPTVTDGALHLHSRYDERWFYSKRRGNEPIRGYQNATRSVLQVFGAGALSSKMACNVPSMRI